METASPFIEILEEISRTIIASSLCGLGQTAPNPVLTTIRYFRSEYEAHIYDKKCPAGRCKALIRYMIDPEKCIECVGFYERTMCQVECPVECCLTNPDRVETEDELLARAKELFPEEEFQVPPPSHFK